MEPNGNSHGPVDAEALKLYSRSQELDKELKMLLMKKSIFDKNVVTIRNNLKVCYEKLVINHYDFSASRDVEQNLWKAVFYKIIEEYRKKIRQSNGSRTEKLDSSAKDDFSKLCESFRSFLHSANKFYNDLIKKLQEKYHLKLDGTEYPMKGLIDDNVHLHKSYLSCHRCYIFLGDLARYHRDLFNHPNQKDWKKAARFYKEALKLIPDNGNPHNQMAVLATYVDDEVGAVYHYFLSLGCSHPFVTARENLQVLFEKNRQKSNVEGTESSEPLHPHFSSELKRFHSRFVRLHGILFSKTGLDKFEEYELEVVREAENLLQKDEISEESLLNIFTINIFAIYNIQHMSESGQGATYSEISQKSLLIKYSISLSLRFFFLALKRSYSGELKFLGAVTVFLDYLRIHADLMKKIDDRDTTTWIMIWKELAKLLTVVGPPETNVSFVQDFPAIKEELNLRGFVPFHQLYRVLPYPTSEIPEEVTKLKRVNKIREFGTFVMNQLPKIPLYFDSESGVFSDQQVIKSKSPQPNGARTISPNMIVNAPRESPLEELPSPSKMDDGENYDRMQEMEARLGLEELVDDVDDEVILFKPGEGNKLSELEAENFHSKSIIGSERIERSASFDKLGSSSPRANHHPPGFDLFGGSGNSNQSFFSFNNLFGHPQQPQQPQASPNSFFGNPFMNNYQSQNGTPVNHQVNHQSMNHQPANHQSMNHQPVNHQSMNHQPVNHQSIHQSPQNPYVQYQQTSPSFSNNESAFGNSYWSPTSPNTFFPSPQGDKIPNYGNMPNGQNPFLTPQTQAPSPQISPYGPTSPMAWLSPNQTQNDFHSPNQKLNELNTGNPYQQHPPQQLHPNLQQTQHTSHSIAPPPGFQPLGSANAQNLPFPFPGGSNQQPRFKAKNPFVS